MHEPGHSWLTPELLARVDEFVGTPAFVYSEQRFRDNLDRIRRASENAGIADRVELYVPFFANANPHLFAPLKDFDNTGILLQLPGEHKLLRSHGFDRFIVSPGYVSDAEVRYWSDAGYPSFLSSLDETAFAIESGMPECSIRIDSLNSGKPGIKLTELDELVKLLDGNERSVDRVEVYFGSGNTLAEMIGSCEQVFEVVNQHFPFVTAIDFAGGHGFDYELWDAESKHFDWDAYLSAVAEAARRAEIPDHVRFMLEPARDLLADTGALLLGIERDVVVTDVGNIVVTDGSRTLMPSAQQRDRRHNVIFLDETMQQVSSDAGVSAAIRGRTILRNDYLLPEEYDVPPDIGKGSFLAILDAGAYCATQHLEFLSVPPAPEVLVRTDGSIELISSGGDELDRWRNVLPESKVLVTGPAAP